MREMDYGDLEGAKIAGDVGLTIKQISQPWKDGDTDVRVGGGTVLSVLMPALGCSTNMHQ
jgi:hypothetical protein